MNVMVNADNRFDPYSGLLRSFVLREFALQQAFTKGELLDALTEAILATGQVRFGPKPSPESQVKIREIVQKYIGFGRPIPFLLPWGSEKPDGGGIDIAELSALKTLICLQERIRRVYEPGAEFVIRLEDVSAPHLFYERMEAAKREAELYCTGFAATVAIIGADKFITPFLESSRVNVEDFNHMADLILPHMEQHVINPEEPSPLETLQRFGWKGQLAPATIDYYMGLYEKLYPRATLGDKTHRVARYFSGVCARKYLDLMGNKPEWGNDFLELSFVPAAPGFDPNRLMKRVFYRTMPSGITSNHIAPWRAKGYVRICGENTVKPALASFNEKLDYNKAEIVLEKDGRRQVIRADYVVME